MRLPAGGMREPQQPGMQHDPRNHDSRHSHDLGPPIGLVTQNGMLNRRQMHPQLMGPPRSGSEFHSGGYLSISLLDQIVGRRGPGLGSSGRKFLPLFRITSDCQVDETLSFLGDAPHQCLIHPVDSV